MCVLFIASCGKKKETVSASRNATVATPPPEWVGNRPHSSAYYIGIGSCSKFAQPYDFQTVAKKNALNDLASEISVRVQGQTFLNSLEVNDSFSEEFISNVSTSTDEKIEDYEVAGSWEDKNEYWIYYRLDKARYQAAKQAKKSAAMNMANDFYQKALTAEGEANLVVAFDLYMRALFALKEYWNESNEMLTEKGKVFLDNEIFSSVQRMCSGIQLQGDVQKISLSAANGYKHAAVLSATYAGKPVKGLTIDYTFKTSGDQNTFHAMTSDQGQVTCMVSSVDYTSTSNTLQAQVDLKPLLVADLDKEVQEGLLKSFKTEKRIIPIEAVLPAFIISSNESIYGTVASGKVLQSALSGALVNKGMRIASNGKEADYSVTITADTKEGGSANGFVVAFLEFTVVVRNTENQEIVFNETLSSIKGLQLNKDAAGIEAYKKGKEKIEQQLAQKLIQTIL
ncbi:MAG: LPP20 family lipoprotein [Flavobacteriales bacterium]